jgi:hypothetical protein
VSRYADLSGRESQCLLRQPNQAMAVSQQSPFIEICYAKQQTVQRRRLDRPRRERRRSQVEGPGS